MGLSATSGIGGARLCLAHARDRLMGRAGLIRELRDLPGGGPDTFVHRATCRPADTGVYTGRRVVGETCGLGATRLEAHAGAVGEWLERYSASVYQLGELVLASADELGAAAVPFASFFYYDPAQYAESGFPLPAPARDLPMRWARARELGSERVRFVPACLVYMPYFTDRRHDYLTPAFSTGQACHVDRDAARLSALCEVIERDALAITWLNELSRGVVDLRGDPELAAMVETHLPAGKVRAAVVDITSDVAVPAMLCAVQAVSERGPLVAIGAAAHPDGATAIRKAVIEAAAAVPYARALLAGSPAWRPGPSYRNVTGFPDHVRLFCEPDHAAAAGFLVAGPRVAAPPRVPPASPRDNLARCVEALAARGLTACEVDLTTPDLAAAGFTCAKVLVPGAAPVSAIHAVQALGSPRLRAVPAHLGLRPRASWNPVPHPLA